MKSILDTLPWLGDLEAVAMNDLGKIPSYANGAESIQRACSRRIDDFRIRYLSTEVYSKIKI